VGLILKLKSNRLKIIFWRVQFVAINQSISRFYAVKGRKNEKIKIARGRVAWTVGMALDLQRKVGDRSSRPERTARRRNHIVCVLVGIRENPASPALRRASLLMSEREERDDGDSKQQRGGTLIAGKKKFSSCDKVL
jgi:hypothetical protein